MTLDRPPAKGARATGRRADRRFRRDHGPGG